jgi:peptide/nickel transport system substrate-binding protein
VEVGPNHIANSAEDSFAWLTYYRRKAPPTRAALQQEEAAMVTARLTRRRVLQTAALAASGLTIPLLRKAGAAAETVVPKGTMVLAWHTNIAPRWLDPQQHDGGATPDNFFNALHDALIKNFYDRKFDYPALAEHFEFAEDAKSALFRLRPGLKFHNGAPVTPADVKWSYEHYHGAWAKVLHEKTDRIETRDDRTIRFVFNAPFLDFPPLIGTANVCGAGWIVPAKYYQEVGQDGFTQKPIGAGPYKLVAQETGIKLEFEAFADYYRPVHIKNFTIVSVPDPATRVAMLERGEADIIYGIPGELVGRIKDNPKFMLAPVVSGNFWLEFPGFQDPKNPFHDKRVREAVSLAIDRDAINQAESGGLGQVDGNWINDDVQYGLVWPKWPVQSREGEATDGRGRLSQRLQCRLADACAALLFARRARHCATAGDRHPHASADPGTGSLPETRTGRA